MYSVPKNVTNNTNKAMHTYFFLSLNISLTFKKVPILKLEQNAAKLQLTSLATGVVCTILTNKKNEDVPPQLLTYPLPSPLHIIQSTLRYCSLPPQVRLEHSPLVLELYWNVQLYKFSSELVRQCLILYCLLK